LLWPDDEPSLGSKLVAIEIKLFTCELVVIVNIYRNCIPYPNGYVSYQTEHGIRLYIELTDFKQTDDVILTFIIWPLNLNDHADGQNYFSF
jgi:hypothetical protein